MKKTISVLFTILCLLLLQTVVSADENAQSYLNAYYGISFSEEVSMDDYNTALIMLGAEPLSGDDFNLAAAVVGAVQLAEMDELALTYTNEKAGQKAFKTLEKEGISVNDAYVPYIACALDLGLIDDNDFNGPVSAQTAAVLLYRAAELSGKGRRSLGRLSDDFILNHVRDILDSTIIFDEPEMNLAGINILVNEAATGYSLKYNGYDANFIEENTIRYGHDDPTHLLQLIALLQREGFDGYVQIEPKVSVYEYMPEWGEPRPSTVTYSVREMTEGRFFAFSAEYELAIEFDTAAQKEAFHDLIETYAKKYDDRVDADGNPMKGLLAQSWWQPFYYSMTEMENQEFEALTDNVIFNADHTFSIRSTGLPEQSAAIAEAAADVNPDLQAEERTIYVNPAFYRYITGSDYQ